MLVLGLRQRLIEYSHIIIFVISTHNLIYIISTKYIMCCAYVSKRGIQLLGSYVHIGDEGVHFSVTKVYGSTVLA